MKTNGMWWKALSGTLRMGAMLALAFVAVHFLYSDVQAAEPVEWQAAANHSGQVNTGPALSETISGEGRPSDQVEAPDACYTLYRYTSPTAGGNVLTYPPPNCNLGTQYLQGTEVTVTAVNNPGYSFSYWTGDASGSSNPVVVVMNGTRTVTANFSTTCYTLTRGVTPTGAGNIVVSLPPNCPNGTQYLPGTVVQLTAVPGAGNVFSYWSGDLSGSANPDQIVMNGHKTVYANFNQQCYTLTRLVNPGGGGAITSVPGPNCPNGTQYLPGTDVTLTAVNAAGYTFSFWSGNASGSSNPIVVRMNGNRTVQANFNQICHTLTRSISPIGTGNILTSPAPNCLDGVRYLPGTMVQLTAAPVTGYAFVNWSGDLSGSLNPSQLAMNGDRTVTANFTLQCYTVALATSPPGGGSISADPAPNCNAGTQYTYGTTVQLTAIPASGYFFKAWSGDLAGSTNPGQILVNAAKSVLASFELPPPVCLQISPDMVLTGSSDFTLSAIGSSFTPFSTVRWNSTNLTTQYISSQLLKATVPAALVASSGTALITVYTPAPGGGLSAPLSLLVGSTNPAPVLISSNPPALAPSGENTPLRLLGRNFISGVQVTWNGNPLPASFVDSTELALIVPGSYLSASGVAQVFLTNPAPGGGDSLILQILITPLYYLPLMRN